MGLVIHKYGGTSVGSVENIKLVAGRIAREKRYNDLVVVVSAMAGETDRLLLMARELSENPMGRELAMLLSSGERVTIALLSMALHEFGCKAVSMTGRQVGIITDDRHTNARIQEVQTRRVLAMLKKGFIPVVAGFQGITRDADITTLGRGGSDTTAVALAAALDADCCHIFTDVDGVYTTDPSIVPEARKLDKITCEEMLEMASLGAKVLHVRSVHFAMKYSVPLSVRSTFSDGSGTMVVKEVEEMEQAEVSGITLDREQCRVTTMGLPDKPGVAFSVFDALARKDVNVDMIIQNVSHDGMADISFTVGKADRGKAIEVMETLFKDSESLLVTDDIAKISIIGAGMKSQPGIAATMFGVMAKEGINIMMISTSEIKISCIIARKYAELAIRTLHEAFDLGRVQK